MAQSIFSIADQLKRALASFQAGNLDAAEQLLKPVLKAQPRSFDALHLMGMIAARRGRQHDAEELIGRAIKANPKVAAAHLNLGNVLAAQNRHQDAVASYDRALALRPDYAEALSNRGVALHRQHRLEEAAASLGKALALKPDNPGARNNLGNVLKDQGRLAEAVGAYRQAIALRPAYADAYLNLGDALMGQDQLPEAADCFRKAIAIDAGNAAAHDRLGTALYADGKMREAIGAYQRALDLRIAATPVAPAVQEACRQLIELTDLPVMYADEEEVASSRRRFAQTLAKIEAAAAALGDAKSAAEQSLVTQCVFKVNNFALGYHLADDRPLQERYAALAARLLQPGIDEFLGPIERRRGGKKIRVGVASELLRLHNGAKWTYGWLANFPRDDYEFFFYSLQGLEDSLTRKMAATGTYRWLPFREDTYLESMRRIRADELDALIVPDIGMTVSSRIASLARLAPIQCMTCGHPVTSGSPNIDYFLSGELVEPAGGDAHCTEQVVRLPNIGVRIDLAELEAPPATRAQFGLPADRTIFSSVQQLMKYLPRYDEIFPRIAREVPDSLFVFVRARRASMTEAFEERLRKLFAGNGLDFDRHVRFLPFMPHVQFVQLFDAIDVNLDSLGWSGGNTTAQSIARDCPVVTMPGEFMRGCFSHGMLRMIGLEELSAPTVKDFVRLAVRLARDRGYRAAIKAKIAAHKHKLFNDIECARALDQFLKEKVLALT